MVAQNIHPEIVADYAADNLSGPGLCVVLYLRQSDKEQRLSVGQQRKECRAYAQSRGWTVVAEYVDDGKSGSKNIAKRVAWHRMIADAQGRARGWDAVLCWDTARFGRLDALTGAPYKQKLREAGVWLETARGQRIDWRRSQDRMLDAMESEANHKYSLDISANVRRGRRAVHDLGYVAKRVPFGYDRQYVDGDTVKLVVPRREVFGKPRNWHLLPIPNEAEAAVVTWMFEQWSKRDIGFCQTVKELYERGTPNPAGKPSWTIAQVKSVLTEKMHVGDLSIGNGGRTKEVHGRIGTRTKTDALKSTALVDRRTFDLVQRKVKAREGAEWRPKTASGPLSGILKCGKCGHTLARRNIDGVNKYVCESANKRREHGCSQWRVDEAELLPVITKELIEAIDFEIVQRIQAKPDQRSEGELAKLRADEARLRKQVEQAAANLLLVDPANFALAQDAMGKIRQEHERVANALKLVQSDAGRSDAMRLAKWWADNRQTFVSVAVPESEYERLAAKWVEALPSLAGHDLRSNIKVAVPVDALRDLLIKLDVSVTLWWESYGASGTRWRLTTGVLRAQWLPDGLTVVPQQPKEASSEITRNSSGSASSCAIWRTA